MMKEKGRKGGRDDELNIYIYLYGHIFIFNWTNVCMYVYLCYVCMYVCMHECIHIIYIHTYIYI